MKRLSRIALATSLVLVLTGCEAWPTFLDPAGPVAEKEAEIFWISHVLSVPVFLIVAGLLLYNLVRFRARQGRDVSPIPSKHETSVEVIYTAVPLVLVVGLFFLTVGYMNAVEEPEHEDRLVVHVIANRWYWEFEYPGYNFVTADEFHVPVDTNVQLIMDTPDIIHTMWVPELAGKQDVIPGETNVMWFRANEIGEYPGACAEFCGTQHAKMRLKVIVDTPEDFARWMDAMQQPPAQPETELQRVGYDMLTGGMCAGCHSLGAPGDTPLLGPDLTHLFKRTSFAGGYYALTEENLRDWLRDNQAMKPGNLMGELELSDRQIEALIAYFMLSAETDDTENGEGEPAAPATAPATEAAPEDSAQAAVGAAP